MAFLKQASLKIENPDITIDSWVVKNNSNLRIAATNKLVEYKNIIADFNPDNYLLTHCTIVASVDVEDAPKPVNFVSEKTKKEFEKLIDRKDYYITPETSKYVNSNGDSWSRELLKTSYKSFVGAENYVEHVQDPTLSKGKILDAAIREVDEGKSLFVDILVATDKKHSDLVRRIKAGELTTLSMGAVVGFTICTQCGRVASDETETCPHIKFFKKNSFIGDSDGKKRVTAELCAHFLYPEANTFIEGSWVKNPAFKGAVLRNELEINATDKLDFIEQYAPIMQIKNPDLRKEANRIISAFRTVDKIQNALNKKSLTEDPLDVPAPSEEPISPPVEDIIPDEPIKEEAPITEEPLPEEIEEEARKPFDFIKDDIKESLKEQIKKELLEELGFKTKSNPYISDINLNDNIIDSRLKTDFNKIKEASSIIKKKGFKELYKLGFKHLDVLKLAFMSKRYSINKDIFMIIGSLNPDKYSTFRRYCKAIEGKLGRELAINERANVEKLVREVF